MTKKDADKIGKAFVCLNCKKQIIIDKLIDVLVGLELTIPCDSLAQNGDICEKYCDYSVPQKECWLRYAKETENAEIKEEIQ